MYHSGSGGVLVVFLGPLSRPTGEKGYVSFRELGSTSNLSWATTRPLGRRDMYHSGSWGVLVIFLGPLSRPIGEKEYVSLRERGSTGNLSWVTIETHWGEGVCIIQGAGEYW